MQYYLMSPKASDRGTVISQVSHDFTVFKTGQPLENFGSPPMVCQLLGDFANGQLPTFYMSPAVIGTTEFYRELLECGVDNIEAFPAKILDPVTDREIDNYLLLNILGRKACTDMDASKYHTLAEGAYIIDKLVLDPGFLERDQGYIFVADEDTDCIIVNEPIYRHISSRFDVIHFEALSTA